MVQQFKKHIVRNLSNLPGWNTNRKIVVFESDDWGSIRMPSVESFLKLKNLGVDMESGDYARYNTYDTLANQEDLEMLFEVLEGIKDQHGNSCVFTAVCVVANPDFKKIRESGFEKYFYEPFTETLKDYYPNQNVFGAWKKGMSRNLFVPQFHGREHLNVIAWLKSLRMGNRDAILAFEEGLWCFVPERSGEPKAENQAAFELTDISDLVEHKSIIFEGLNLFEMLFGYRAKYFVPPNGPINNSLNRVLAENGILFRSAAKLQNESIGLGKTKKVIHWLGQEDTRGIRYITRNCFFEPSQPRKDWVNDCLKDINIAFRWRKPAIISSHRVNYIGVHCPENRNNSLQNLKTLLTSIKKYWPDVEFMSTDKLGELMYQ